MCTNSYLSSYYLRAVEYYSEYLLALRSISHVAAWCRCRGGQGHSVCPYKSALPLARRVIGPRCERGGAGHTADSCADICSYKEERYSTLVSLHIVRSQPLLLNSYRTHWTHVPIVPCEPHNFVSYVCFSALCKQLFGHRREETAFGILLTFLIRFKTRFIFNSF